MSNLLLPLLGGALIGLSATLLLLLYGQIAGISGILGVALAPGTSSEERSWRGYFLLGLIGAGALLAALLPQAFQSLPGGSFPRAALAGVLVGFGTRLGSGCTSGHGVCGISRFSVRSIVATVTFIAFGALTVLVVRTLGGAV
jgi:uncharacterized protein